MDNSLIGVAVGEGQDAIADLQKVNNCFCFKYRMVNPMPAFFLPVEKSGLGAGIEGFLILVSSQKQTVRILIVGGGWKTGGQGFEAFSLVQALPDSFFTANIEDVVVVGRKNCVPPAHPVPVVILIVGWHYLVR